MDMNTFYYQVDKLLESNNLQDAESFMESALRSSMEEKDDVAVISICNELASFYREAGRFDESIPLYETALRLMGMMELEKSQHYATTLINYATTYTRMHETQKALSLYDHAAQIYEECGITKDYGVATMYNNMGLLYEEMGESQKSENCHTTALEILKGINDSELSQAITYSNLAGHYLDHGDLIKAKLNINQSIELFINNSGKSTPQYAGAISTLGEIFFMEGEYKKAKELFEEALAIAEATFGNETDSYAIIIENLKLCNEKIEIEKADRT